MLNAIFLTGRLGKAPRHYNAGETNERANFSVAVDQGRGENRSTHWIDIVVFGRAASTIVENVQVGQELHIKGRLQADRKKGKDDTGQYDRELWSVVADSFDGVTFGRTPNGGSASNGNSGGQVPAGVAAGNASGDDDEPPF